MSKNKAIKKPIYTAEELNSNIAYGMTTINNITQSELNSIQWLCEKSMNDDIKIKNLQSQLAITQKALELAVKDKCKFENSLLSTSLGITGGKVAVPKKEQYYIEQAKEMLENE